MNNIKDPRKFLRIHGLVKKPEPGTNFPIQLNIKTEYFQNIFKMHWDITHYKGAVCFFISEYCDTCREDSKEAIVKYASMYPEFKYFVFTECNMTDFENQKNYFPKNCELINCDIKNLAPQIELWGIPCVYALNNIHQIIACNNYRNIQELESITSILIQASKSNFYERSEY